METQTIDHAKSSNDRREQRRTAKVFAFLTSVAIAVGAHNLANDAIDALTLPPSLEELEEDSADAQKAYEQAVETYESTTSAACNDVLTRYHEEFEGEGFEATQAFEQDYFALYGEPDTLTTQLIIDNNDADRVGPCGDSAEAVESQNAYYDVHHTATALHDANEAVGGYDASQMQDMKTAVGVTSTVFSLAIAAGLYAVITVPGRKY